MTDQERNNVRIRAYKPSVQKFILCTTFGVPADEVSVMLDWLEETPDHTSSVLGEIFPMEVLYPASSVSSLFRGLDRAVRTCRYLNYDSLHNFRSLRYFDPV